MITFLPADTCALLTAALKEAGVEYETDNAHVSVHNGWEDGKELGRILGIWRWDEARRDDEFAQLIGPAFSICEAEEAIWLLLKAEYDKGFRIYLDSHRMNENAASIEWLYLLSIYDDAERASVIALEPSEPLEVLAESCEADTRLAALTELINKVLEKE